MAGKMIGEFSQVRDDELGREMEEQELREAQDPVFLPDEQAIAVRHNVRQLVEDGADIKALLPDDIPVQEYWNYLGVFGQAFKRAETTSIRIRKAIGRLMQIASKNPQYRDGKPMKEFVPELESRTGLDRSVCYQAMRIYNAFPSLPPSDWEDIGIKNLEVLCRFTNETFTDVEKHLQAGREMTTSELTGYAEASGLKSRGELVGCVITIPCTVSVRDVWEEFKSDPENQKSCGTDRAEEMLVHAIHDATTEWHGRPLPLLVIDPSVRDIVEQFVENKKVQKAAGTSDHNLLLAWGLARCLEGVS